MIRLLSCPQGHYWEAPQTENGAAPEAAQCPLCGAATESLPLLDLAPTPVLSRPAAPADAELPLRDEAGWPVVAGYEILKELGRSPTGVLRYQARQQISGQQVLLEVVIAREDPSQQAWGSLRSEASALGRLHHPNIVRLLEAGERQRQLFYNAVEWIDALPLEQFLGGKRLAIAEALALVEVLARAMHHAHERGVVHRSLKPASILLEPLASPGRGRAAPMPPVCRLKGLLYLPRITHFGQPRRPSEGEVADLELQEGLPFYLAPEQAWGRAREIGPATDVHALGAILYELLAGKPPFGGQSPLAILEAIQCQEAPLLARVRSRLPVGLNTLCRKCLAKAPRRRFRSAQELADELHLCAQGYPIRAEPASVAKRIQMTIGRHRYAAAMLLLIAITAISLLAAFRTPRRPSAPTYMQPNYPLVSSQLRDEVKQAQEREQQLRYIYAIQRANRALEADDFTQARSWLDSCPTSLRDWEWNYLNNRRQAVRDLKMTWPIRALAVSADGRYLAAGSAVPAGGQSPKETGEVIVWSVPGQRPSLQLRWSYPHPIESLAFSDDGSRLAILCSDSQAGGQSEVAIRWLPRGDSPPAAVFPNACFTSLAFMPTTSDLLVAGPKQPLRLLDGQHPAKRELSLGSKGTVLRAFFAPPTGHIALVNADGRSISVLDPLTFLTSMELAPRHSGEILDLAFSSRTGQLASASRDRTIVLRSLEPVGAGTKELRGHTGPVTGVTFTPNGKRLASASTDGTVKLWDTQTGLEVLSLPGFADASAIAFGSPDNLLAVAHGSRLTLLWSSPP